MAMRISISKRVFNFAFKALTSRGVMKDKTSWFLRVEDDAFPGISGWGECGPLPGLSVDFSAGFGNSLAELVSKINESFFNCNDEAKIRQIIPASFPSVLFGVETALMDLRNGGRRIIFQNSFCEGNPIPINGLVWMGDIKFMMDQVNTKISQGFSCIKLKVGGLDFDRECDILRYIRKKYSDNVVIRLDANGAFKAADVLDKLNELAKFQIHSIEQPIRPGLGEMAEVCRKSPIPVAFDEELIGVFGRDAKVALIKKFKPQFIVLKPTLHGGLYGCDEWISVAESMRVGWWITSALESSIGLNAICQFTANYQPILPQGLGTGAIYTNNVVSPLGVRNGNIFWDPAGVWEELYGHA